MKKLLTTIGLLICLCFIAKPAVAATDPGIPILMYHHFTTGNDTSAITVSKNSFNEQMNYLAQNGYKTLSFEELEAYLDGKLENNGKMVVLTMDDGYRSNYEIAFPILQYYGLKATQFTIVSAIGGLDENMFKLGFYGGTHCSINEMQKMQGTFDFQSHTYDRHFIFNEKSILAQDFTVDVREDLDTAKQILEDNGFSQYVFSYPYGESSGSIKQVLKEQGVRMAVNCVPKRVKRGADKMELPRLNVSGKMSLEDFKKLVQAPK